MQESIERRGGDPSRFFLFGHSAGASHVAAYVARPEFHAARTRHAGAMMLSGVYRVTPELWRNRLRAAGRPFASATFAAHSHVSEAYSIHSRGRTVGDALWAFVEANR